MRHGRSPQAGLKRERRVAQNGSEAGSPVAGVAARYASALFELARDERDIGPGSDGRDGLGDGLSALAKVRAKAENDTFWGHEPTFERRIGGSQWAIVLELANEDRCEWRPQQCK